MYHFKQNDPGSGFVAGAKEQYRAEYFNTYVKANIYCKKPKPSEADFLPGSTSYRYNIIRKSISVAP